MSYDDTAVAIFCKAPIAGNVKTRLAASIGTTAATSLYRCCAEHVVWNTRHSGLPTVVFMDKSEAAPAFHDWLGGMLAVQIEGDLGAKMAAAISELLTIGYHRVLLIGTDTPFVDEEIIRDAAIKLLQHDVVIGPAEDGGYYLIGTNADRPGLFKGIEWSTDSVLQDTMAICERENWSVAQTVELFDMDTKEDLDRILNSSVEGHEDFLRKCHLILKHTVTG